MKRIYLENCENIRDLGGEKGIYGTVNSGKLIRSAKLDKISAKDADLLKNVHNVDAIIDLRTEKEAEKMPDVTFGSNYYILPLRPDVTEGVKYGFPESIKAFSKKFPSMPEMYINMVSTDYSVKKLREIFKIIFENVQNGGAVLFHCTEGKDRTGIIATMALMLLGVDRQNILNDYIRSNYCFSSRNNRIYIFTLIAFLDRDYARGFRTMYEADRSMLESIFSYIDSCGGIEEYFKTVLGFSSEEINRFKASMFE